MAPFCADCVEAHERIDGAREAGHPRVVAAHVKPASYLFVLGTLGGPSICLPLDASAADGRSFGHKPSTVPMQLPPTIADQALELFQGLRPISAMLFGRAGRMFLLVISPRSFAFLKIRNTIE